MDFQQGVDSNLISNIGKDQHSVVFLLSCGNQLSLRLAKIIFALPPYFTRLWCLVTFLTQDGRAYSETSGRAGNHRNHRLTGFHLYRCDQRFRSGLGWTKRHRDANQLAKTPETRYNLRYYCKPRHDVCCSLGFDHMDLIYCQIICVLNDVARPFANQNRF
jgi:hypothetical protein